MLKTPVWERGEEGARGGRDQRLRATGVTRRRPNFDGWIGADGCGCWAAVHLSTESVERASLSLERVDDVHGRDGLSARVLGVGDGVADDVLEEDLEHAARLLVDESADSLDSASARQAADGRLGDALDVVAKDLAVALGAALAESLASFAASGHVA